VQILQKLFIEKGILMMKNCSASHRV